MSGPSPPRTYAEWVVLLDQFRDNDQQDDVLLESMRQGSLDWTNVVAERWTRQMADTLSARLRTLSKHLQRGLDQARGDQFAISQALLKARRALVSIYALTSLPCLDERVRAHLSAELTRWTRETQDSLEKGARQERSDGGRFLKLLRDHSLVPVVASPQSNFDPAPVPEVGGRPRRVIL